MRIGAPAREHPASWPVDRYGNRSTIITSQLPPSKWHEYLGDPTVADAILNRLLHNAHRIVLKGPSRRKEEVPTAARQPPASLRSDHDALDGPITMRRND